MSGGQVNYETCTVTGVEFQGFAHYSNGTEMVEDAMSLYEGTPMVIPKPSLLWFEQYDPAYGLGNFVLNIDGDAELLTYDSDHNFLLLITGDCTISC